MKVKVKYANRNEFSPDRNPLELTGEFRGVDNEILVISTEKGMRCIPVSEVRSMEEIDEDIQAKNISDIYISSNESKKIGKQGLKVGCMNDVEQTTEFKPIVTEDKEVATLKNSEAPQVEAEEPVRFRIVYEHKLIIFNNKTIEVLPRPEKITGEFSCITKDSILTLGNSRITFDSVPEVIQRYIHQISHLW